MLQAIAITLLLVAGVGIVAAIDRRKSVTSLARLGRRWRPETPPPLPSGADVWAWREGAFERARVLAHRTGMTPGRVARTIYRVAFVEAPETEVEIPSALVRTGADRPDTASGHEWHRRRRQEILRGHPEILTFKAPPAIVYVGLMAGCIALQLAMGGMVALHAHQAFIGLWTLALAATIGAFCAYALQQMTHEACHTQPRRSTRLLALAADIMLGTSGPCFYSYYFQCHLPHHANTGDEGDPDIMMHGHWAVLPKWAAGTRIGRFLWLSLLGLFTFEILIIENLVGRIPQPRLSIRNRRLVALLLLKYAFMGLVWAIGGIWCLVYFRLAAAFSLGAFGHPYAGFWLMQHASVAGNGFQPTVSYGGSWLWHWLTLGELYHVEHHDFPWVPFNRIAEVRQVAPAYYRDLCVVPSVWRLTWQWLSHTDGSPWMDVAGVLDCINPPETRSHIHRPAPEVLPAAS